MSIRILLYFIAVLIMLPACSNAQKYDFRGIFVHDNKDKPKNGDTINEVYTTSWDSFRHTYSVIHGNQRIDHEQYGTWKIYKQQDETAIDTGTHKQGYFERLYIKLDSGAAYGYFQPTYAYYGDFTTPNRNYSLCIIVNGKLFIKKGTPTLPLKK